MQSKANCYAEAMIGRDLAQLLTLLSDDVSVHGPDGATRGQTAVCRLFRRRFALGAGIDITGVTVEGRAVTIAYRARFGDSPTSGSDRLRFGADGRIEEVRLQPSPAERLALMPVAGRA